MLLPEFAPLLPLWRPKLRPLALVAMVKPPALSVIAKATEPPHSLERVPASRRS